jgi:ornithine cyclodeaminase/alanine dehydrogenase-like protein (mu-crystallin family)
MYVASIGGSDASNKRREIDDETIRRADLYVVHAKDVAKQDQSPDVWEIAQKGIKSWESIAEIQDLVAGKVQGRTNADQITVFNNNTGAGTQFAAVGAAVLKRARAMGLGRELPTEWFLEEVSP